MINLTDSSMISSSALDVAFPNMESEPRILVRDENPSSKVSASDVKHPSSHNQFKEDEWKVAAKVGGLSLKDRLKAFMLSNLGGKKRQKILPVARPETQLKTQASCV